MQNRAITYLRKSKARKIVESPLEADLKTFLSATMALSRSNVVKKHINIALQTLQMNIYKLSA